MRHWKQIQQQFWVPSAFVVFLLLWEGGVRLFHVHPGILPPFSMVVERGWQSRTLLVSHITLTLMETLLGFALAFATAGILATLFDCIPLLRRSLFPLLTAFQSIPKVAFAPILVIWFGHGMLPNVVMAALVAFFPLLVNIVTGLDSTSEELELFMDSLAASWQKRFLKVRLPSAVPYILSGCRIAMTYAIIGAIVGEFVNPSRGLGYIMATAQENFDTSLQFSAILIVSVMGWLLYHSITLMENIFLRRFTYGTRAAVSEGLAYGA
jgi:NitT/TauT family transport system permease protein